MISSNNVVYLNQTKPLYTDSRSIPNIDSSRDDLVQQLNALKILINGLHDDIHCNVSEDQLFGMACEVSQAGIKVLRIARDL